MREATSRFPESAFLWYETSKSTHKFETESPLASLYTC